MGFVFFVENIAVTVGCLLVGCSLFNLISESHKKCFLTYFFLCFKRTLNKHWTHISAVISMPSIQDLLGTKSKPNDYL